MTITLITRYVEGDRKVRHYKTLKAARKAAAERFGTSPERGGGYVHDDYAVLYVEGCTFDDLFPDSYEAIERREAKAAKERAEQSMREYEERVKAATTPREIDDDIPF